MSTTVLLDQEEERLKRLARNYQTFEQKMLEIQKKQQDLLKKAGQIYQTSELEQVREKLKKILI